MANKSDSLAHTKWMCKYHIVFSPKYRRKVIYNQIRKDVGEILRTLCQYKGVEIHEGHLMPDHVHLLMSIPPKYSVSSVMGYLKGKSALMICLSEPEENYSTRKGDRYEAKSNKFTSMGNKLFRAHRTQDYCDLSFQEIKDKIIS